jgi:hypothetical protein
MTLRKVDLLSLSRIDCSLSGPKALQLGYRDHGDTSELQHFDATRIFVGKTNSAELSTTREATTCAATQ